MTALVRFLLDFADRPLASLAVVVAVVISIAALFVLVPGGPTP